MTQEDMQKIEAAVGACGRAANELGAILPESREKSLAMTKIEEAGHWATACLAKHSSTEDIQPVPLIVKPN